MDFETIEAKDFGRSLTGLGLNILVRSVPRLSEFLQEVFSVEIHRQSDDFAIASYAGQVFQLHADHTYHSHPLPSLLPEAGPRGGGLEIRLYETDPDAALERVSRSNHETTILEVPTNKPHGLRECVILCENGYAWVPSRHLSKQEVEEVL